jgi:hypothetical protein
VTDYPGWEDERQTGLLGYANAGGSRPVFEPLADEITVQQGATQSAVQTELVRENLREMIDNTRRISERSVEVASEAARTITAEANKAAERFQRAA